MEGEMSAHVRDLDKKVTALSDALAHLGKGTTMQELLKIIRFPGWTTPAEFAFLVSALDHMQSQVQMLERLQADVLAASQKVSAHQTAK